jgi:hypothetical protein
MLKILEVMANDEMVSAEVTQEIARLIVDKNYDYSIEDNVYIPDVSSHTANVVEPMKANTLLNKNFMIEVDSNLDLIPMPHLSEFFNK